MQGSGPFRICMTSCPGFDSCEATFGWDELSDHGEEEEVNPAHVMAWWEAHNKV